MPRSFFQGSLESKLKRFNTLPAAEQLYIMDRVEYYCKLKSITPLSESALRIADHTLKNKNYPSAYFHDTYEYIRYFNSDLKWEHLFGDIIHVPEVPTIVKSRPLGCDNSNSVMLKLDKLRHFITLKDSTPFEKKDNLAIFRGDIVGKLERHRFLEMYMNHPLCDVGDVSPRPESPIEWQREAMSLYDHLRYKFVFALEGNDVASNLKWVMSTNSLAVMPKPTCEIWFMEGRLRGGEHYVEIAVDYSDVESQLQYYIDHPKEANEISRNANEYTKQFFNPEREDLISLMVLQRYFEMTGQL